MNEHAGDTPDGVDVAWELLPRAIPVSVGALIFDGTGRLLILKPTYKKGWTIPGGVMEPTGETPWQACRREVAEECGVAVDAGRLVAVDTRPAKRGRPPGLRLLFDCGVLDERHAGWDPVVQGRDQRVPAAGDGPGSGAASPSREPTGRGCSADAGWVGMCLPGGRTPRSRGRSTLTGPTPAPGTRNHRQWTLLRGHADVSSKKCPPGWPWLAQWIVGPIVHRSSARSRRRPTERAARSLRTP